MRSRSPSFTTRVSSPIGGIEGGTPPSAGNPKTRGFLVYLCLLSLHKKVGAVWSAQLHKVEGLLKLWFEVECIYSIWDSAPNNTFEKTKVSLCAEAEILQYTRVRNSDQLQAGYINGAKARSKERKIRIGALTARSFSSVISSQMFWVRRKSSLTLETIGDR